MSILSDHKSSARLTDHEYEVLSAVLMLLRDKTEWVPAFLGSLKHHADELADGQPVNHEFLMGDLIQARYNEPTNIESRYGVLMAISQKGGYEEIGITEFKELSDCLKVLRDGGWLSSRISTECRMFAEGSRYTPEQFIQHVIGFEVDEFQMDVESTKDMLRDYPGLFVEDLKALNAAVTEPTPAMPAEEPQPTAPQRKTRKRTSQSAVAMAGSK